MNKEVKEFFFGCSMRGGYGEVSKDQLAQIPDIIEELGHQLASRHQTRDWETSEIPLSPTQIHDRDYAWLIGSEAGVFEISNPSLGVGGEISDLIHLGKPVLCLLKKGLEDKVSAYTRGKQGSQHVKTLFEVHTYETTADMAIIIKNFLETHL